MFHQLFVFFRDDHLVFPEILPQQDHFLRPEFFDKPTVQKQRERRIVDRQIIIKEIDAPFGGLFAKEFQPFLSISPAAEFGGNDDISQPEQSFLIKMISNLSDKFARIGIP